MKRFLFALVLLSGYASYAQKKPDPVYIDKQGVMRWTKDKSEAAFFGVNYTVPFAYGYRSHKALGIDLEKAIDADVHHMARLDLDAFRVHVWDVEISDSLGNLLDNEHLRLFDYLLSKLKQKNIKILITPIAFWGNGYPEPDIKTNGFSYVYGKGPSVVKEEAFKAQENYLRQFFTHVNPYTKLAYKDDPDVIAMEINNEPHHSGPKERTTEYVNRMAAAVKSTGWTKPVFYNISESPAYADAVVKANVDGYSFQWYPTNLVANHERKGNFLPHVDAYRIPFADTIPAFKNRAKMVYEFDAGDVMQPIMYPAMARTYRTAGFQWATQFAYDPLYTAYGNTEYQTHYLNLAYTPAKAISLLIASKVFHKLPRDKSYGVYPADTVFGDFRVSYRQQLSEMNAEDEFYYTGSTPTQPKNLSKLEHVAGVGSSRVVEYEGTGAYFLDKLSDKLWSLEVMPDAIAINDPFEKASPKKEVVKIHWDTHKMKLRLPDFITGVTIVPMYSGDDLPVVGPDSTFLIYPGVYLLIGKSKKADFEPRPEPFYAPKGQITEPVLIHHEKDIVPALRQFALEATIAGVDTVAKISVELRNSSNQWKTVPMRLIDGLNYQAAVPAEMLTPGVINYRIMVRTKDVTYTFPGGFKGNLYAWDEYRNESWQTFVAPPGSPVELFNATTDRNRLMLYNTDWRNNRVEGLATGEPGKLAVKTIMNKPVAGQMMAWQFYFGDRLTGRVDSFDTSAKIMVKARSSGDVTAQLTLIDIDGNAYSASLALSTSWQALELPLALFQKDSCLLLPRPYPGFQNLWFRTQEYKPMHLPELEKIEVRFIANKPAEPVSVEVQQVWLKK
jgi:hypothetical protein